MKNHGHLQLKHPKLRVGGCTEEVLEWFNYPSPSAHPRCEVSCQRVWNKQASLLCLCFVEARTMAECCIALESVLTNSLVSKLLHCCCLHCANFIPQARNTANNTIDGCVRNFSARSTWSAEWLQLGMQTYFWLNIAGWGVTQRTSTKVGGRLPGTTKYGARGHPLWSREIYFRTWRYLH